MESMIVDCDPGVDDAIAIILAHHLANLKGITTVSGNVPLEATTRNALHVISLLDADVPVCQGAAHPLVNRPAHSNHVHGSDGLGGLQPLDHSRRPSEQNAVDFLLETPTSDDWIVAIGPLTNLALAIQRDSEWVNRIKGISLMGGSTSHGNVTASAEFNIHFDPEAAAQVFNSGANIRMCGLNLTHQFLVTEESIERLKHSNGQLARFAEPLLRFLIGRMEKLSGSRVAALHDPCAVLAATHPHLLEFEELSVQVELEGALTRGMTVCDQRTTRRRDPPNVEVAQAIDVEPAMQLLMDTLCRNERN